jgi:hypothetical protein
MEESRRSARCERADVALEAAIERLLVARAERSVSRRNALKRLALRILGH